MSLLSGSLVFGALFFGFGLVGAFADTASLTPEVSGDGRYVAFVSSSSNLVPGDTNGVADVFVYDRETGATNRVSVGPDGTQGEAESFTPAITDDGRYVAFVSLSSNLVSDDTNDSTDVFVHDRETGATTRASVASDGTQNNGHYSHYGAVSPSISADGRYVAFVAAATNLVSDDTNGEDDVFVHDRETGDTTRVSISSDGRESDGYSDTPRISADGRIVAFGSLATNLVGDTEDRVEGVYVHDRETGVTSLVSVAAEGAPGNNSSTPGDISADGRYVAFNSLADNLVPDDSNDRHDVFVYDREVGTTELSSIAADGTQGSENCLPQVALSSDGAVVAFASISDGLVPDDANEAADVFVRDETSGEISRMSGVTELVGSDGLQGAFGGEDPSISADGRLVAFDAYVGAPDPSGPGAVVLGSDILIFDRVTGDTERVAVASSGGSGLISSSEPAASPTEAESASDPATTVPGYGSSAPSSYEPSAAIFGTATVPASVSTPMTVPGATVDTTSGTSIGAGGGGTGAIGGAQSSSGEGSRSPP